VEQFSAANFYTIARLIESTGHNYGMRPADVVPDDAEITRLSDELLQIVRIDCVRIGLPLSARHIDELVEEVRDKYLPLTYGAISLKLTELSNSIRREMGAVLFLYISTEKAKWFRKPLEGWGAAVERFGDTITTDIEEGAKCYACDRHAAAVFHMMLVAEFGALEVGKLIEMRDPKPSWHGVMNEIRRITQQTKFTDLKPIEQKYFKLLEQLSPLMLAMQNAWRHKIDHAANRLVLTTGEFQSYVAEEIITATRAFMRTLASELALVERADPSN
jgi:hypothetical protein